MNVEMLKYMVELSDKEYGDVNVAEFLCRYPDTQKTRRDLDALQNSGYIVAIFADDEIDVLIVDRRGFAYFKQALAVATNPATHNKEPIASTVDFIASSRCIYTLLFLHRSASARVFLIFP